ncbi:uncharacterized protein [Linepithema humile]|uniref:uncharacterized protein isoform X1 n=1 Tax=Linepithema humile TaxID=83485 RepID=UPI00351DFEFC
MRLGERFQQNSEKKKQYIGISEFEKHVVRDLTMIKFDLRTIVDMISQLTQNLSTDAPKEIIHPIKEKDEQPEDNVLPAFLLKNWEQFCEMENLLHTNTVASRQLKIPPCLVEFYILFALVISSGLCEEKMLLMRGGKDAADCTRRMLLHVFAPELAVRVSWLGRKNNERLEGTIFVRALFEAVKHRYKKIDDRAIETAIIDWFRRATDRLKKQEKNV